jgi:hypothetical protein
LHSSLGTYELAVEAGFSLEEALSVVALSQSEQLVVEVVADFVEKGAQESPKGHDLPTLGSAHPQRDSGIAAECTRLIEAVELAARPSGSDEVYHNLEWSYS